MAPFYTAKGDSGDTGFLGEERISKSSSRIEAVGCVDEVNAVLGFARSLSASKKTQTILLTIQKKLYHLMTELSALPDERKQFGKIKRSDVDWLERQIVQLEKVIALPREFIVPGENPSSSALALARTVVRRAERRIVAYLNECQYHEDNLLAYINRLSSLIFILEVFEASLDGGDVRIAKDDAV